MQNITRSTASQPHGFILRLFAVLGAALVFFALAGPAFAAPPNLILSDGNLRDYNSMSAADIQAFLDKQTGPLKSLVTPDYEKNITLSPTVNNLSTTPDAGEAPKPASLIIWEACQQWHISPKVMLVMLEKEQSLLTRTSLGSTTLARAVGAGCPGSLVYPDKADPKYNPVATNRYPGFGNQIWNGARLLDMYGEASKGSGIAPFYPGISYPTYTVRVYPANWATYKLYIYNPSISGNTNFWNIYLKNFGNPAGDPITGPEGAVFRFYNTKLGTHFYSASLSEANSVAALLYTRFRYEGVAYVADPPKNSTPLYRFFNKTKGSHFYTASTSERDNVIKRFSKTFKYEGVAYNVSAAPADGAVTVYRFFNKKNGTHFYTASAAERDSVQARLGSRYTYEGIAFYAMP
jgi:hypothetical protein